MLLLFVTPGGPYCLSKTAPNCLTNHSSPHRLCLSFIWTPELIDVCPIAAASTLLSNSSPVAAWFLEQLALSIG